MPPTNPLRIARRSLYICQSCRQHLRSKTSPYLFLAPDRKRWISQQHMRKIQDAEVEWRNRAREIEAGRMKSMLQTLEERGYINQVVGYETPCP